MTVYTAKLTSIQFDHVQAAILSLMNEQPELSSAGWTSSSNSGASFQRYRSQMRLPNFTEMVLDVFVDLASRRIPARSSSNYQKHVSEGRVGRYITNGAFITGAMLVGYLPRREVGWDGCYFSRRQTAQPHPALCGGDYDRGWIDPTEGDVA